MQEALRDVDRPQFEQTPTLVMEAIDHIEATEDSHQGGTFERQEAGYQQRGQQRYEGEELGKDISVGSGNCHRGHCSTLMVWGPNRRSVGRCERISMSAAASSTALSVKSPAKAFRAMKGKRCPATAFLSTHMIRWEAVVAHIK